MANSNMSIEEVKRVSKSLETSPSKNARQSPLRAGRGKGDGVAKGAKHTSKLRRGKNWG